MSETTVSSRADQGARVPPTWTRITVTSVAYLPVIAAIGAMTVGLKTAEPGLAQVWMAWMVSLVLPVLWIGNRLFGNPISMILEALPWWRAGGSFLRVVLAVAVTLPFVVFMVWSAWISGRWLGVDGW